MLLEQDDLPLHQAPVPLAHTMDGHPNAYDRYFLNAYREDLFVAVALGLYPNRGVIDAAVGVVRNGVQRSVFASGALARRETCVGPVALELTRPMREAVVRVDAPAHGLVGELTFTARTAAAEEPRHLRHQGGRLLFDHTRATQLGTWTGTLEVGGERVDLGAEPTFGTKDRSWGVRPVGDPTPSAPAPGEPQLFFCWTPINFDDGGFHLSTFEGADGTPWSATAVGLDLLEASASPVDPSLVHHLGAGPPHVTFARGLRRAVHATIPVQGAASIELEPVLTFKMRGAGYFHPRFAHGRYHGELVVDGEAHEVGDLDTTAFHDLHTEQVVRATWGDRVGLGTLEVLAIGPHAPSGLRGLTDGAA